MENEKILVILLNVMLVMSVIGVASAFNGSTDYEIDLDVETSSVPKNNILGDGSPEDPYMIYDVHDLQNMSLDLSAHYALANDIDAGETSKWNWNETEGVYRGFEPIGDGENQFDGTFDGGGYTITGLFIYRPDVSGVGLFSHIDEGGYVSNVSLVDVNVTGNNYVGGLVGRSGGFHTPGGTVSNCSASGVLTGLGFRVGGLMGWNSFTTVSNSHAEVMVTADNTGGGLMGENANGMVLNSFSTGNVSGEGNSRGGLVGRNAGVIEDSYATGNVNGSSYLGGLVGYNAGGSISYSYATGSINSTISDSSQAVGGLAGINSGYVNYSYATGEVTGPFRRVGGLVGQNTGVVTNSYATGNVTGGGTGETWEGGLVGDNDYGDGEVFDSFYDQETTGHSDTGKGEPKTTAEMMTESTFTGAGWDFVDTWWMIDGETRPFLQSEWSTEIRNNHQLQLMAVDLTADYTLEDNIDLSDIIDPAQMWGTALNSGQGFVPLGTSGDQFVGNFDGNDHTIHLLYIDRPETTHIGLFGDIGDTGSVFDMGLTELSVKGNATTGGLAGLNRGVVNNTYTTGFVHGTGEYIGGLFGDNVGTVSVSYSTVHVDGKARSGGLVGINRGIISGSFSAGDVKGIDHDAGGFVGQNTGTIDNSYSLANVTGEIQVGGLVGLNLGGDIYDSYSTGFVSGSGALGGLVGWSNGVVANSFYDQETSGRSDTGKGEPKTTAEMQTQSTFTDAGWDFEDIWKMIEGMTYPLLWWQPLPTGEGTPEDPYLIYDVYDLQNMKDDITAHYLIVNDIDGSETRFWNDDAGFLPVGTFEDRFNGSLDGDGHKITGLYINRTSDHIGLFGVTEYAEIKDVGLVDVEIQGGGYTGGIAGYTEYSTISRSYVTGVVNGGFNVGGLIGRTWMGSVEHSYADVDVYGGTWAGGLIGFNDVCTVSNTYARGDVYGSSTIGGLIGRNDRAAVEYSYSTGYVSGDSNVGGLVGSRDPSGGYADIANFWDNQTSGQTGSAMGTGKNTTEMKTQTTFTDEAWDFTDTWWMIENATYPLLWYQPVAVGITSPYDGQVFASAEVTVEWLGGTNGSGTVSYSIRIEGGEWIDKGGNTTHQFSGLEEGEYTVDVKVYDTANNSALDTVKFIVDLTEPNVEITSPSDGEAFSSTNVTVEWTGSDDVSGIDYYEVKIGEEDWIYKALNTTHLFTDLEEGIHTVYVRVTDNAGNNATDNVTFTVDVTDPNVEIISPGDGDVFSTGNVTVEWTGSDMGSGISHYEIRLNEGEWDNVGTDTEYIFEGLTDGEHTVDVRALDHANNSAVDNVTFIVDLTDPLIDIVSPYDGEVISSVNITVEWTGSDDASGIDYYEIRIDGGEWTNVGLNTSHQFTDLEEGDHTVDVRVTDNAGNNATDSVTFTVDITPPTVTITSPDEGQIFNVSDITVQWIGSDDETGISHYEIRLNDEDWMNVGNDTEYILEGVADGEHTVYVRAFDFANNTDTDDVNFTVDVTAPSVDITSPSDGEAIPSVEVTVEWTGSDDTSGIDYYEIRIDGGEWIHKGLQTTHDFTDLDEGSHTVDVRATDNADNSAVDPVTFVVDVSDPTVSITSPDEGEIFGSTEVTVEWDGSDDISGIDHYEIRLDDGDWEHLDMDTSYTFQDLEEGHRTVEVRVTDKAGNDALDSVTFIVDVSDPTVSIISPEEGEEFDTTEVTVEWIGDDEISGIDNYEVRINQGTWQDKELQTTHIFTDLAEGEHTVDVRAYDKAGNSATDTVTFTIEFEISYIVISPDYGSISAGDSIEYTARAYDEYGGDKGDVTDETTWSIEEDAGGYWDDNVYFSQYADEWIVTGVYYGMEDTANLRVLAGDVHSIVISPEEETITAGDYVDYTAYAYDVFGNEKGEVLPTYSIEEDAGGSWSNRRYHSEFAGTWTVMGTYDGVLDTATLIVDPGDVIRIEISPQQSTITAGDTQEYTAVAYDGYDNEIEDVTADTHWSIDSNAGGYWDNNVYHSENAGYWAVTGTYGEISGTAYLTVESKPVSYMIIEPQEASIDVGASQSYTATAYDEDDNEIGDVTDDTTWSINSGAGGYWTYNEYTSENAGTWTVTGTYDGFSDQATLTVLEDEIYTLTMDVIGNGWTEPPTGVHEYEVDTFVLIEAFPHEGWVFSHWTGDYPPGEAQHNIISTTMDSDKQLTAHFVEEDVNRYELIISVEGMGTVNIDPDLLDYPEGTIVTLTVTPNPGWQFVEWRGDISGSHLPAEVHMSEDKNVTAVFTEAEAEFRITNFVVNPTEGDEPLTVGITAEIENVGTSEGSIELTMGGTLIQGWTVEPGETVPVDETYIFESSGLFYIRLGDESIAIRVGDVVVHTLNLNHQGQGSVLPEEELYEQGTSVTLTAVAEDGWKFVEWTGAHNGTDESITFTMDEDKTITAVFREIEDDPEPTDPSESGLNTWLLLAVILVVFVILAVVMLLKKKSKGGNTEQMPQQDDPHLDPEETQTDQSPTEDQPPLD